MSTLSLLPLSLLESEGVAILQQAADAALGTGVLTVTSDSNGISTGLKLSSGQTVNIDNVTIGSGGLSGRIFVEGLDANPLSATLFDGFIIALTAFDVTLAHGGLAQSHIGGRFTVPFFTDPSGNSETVDVELGFKSDGSFSLSLAAVETQQSTTPDGLVQLKYALPGGLGSVELDVASFELDRAPDGSFKIVISGTLIMETEGLQWPTFELRGLGIDSKGHVSLDGGWINLPSQCSLDFFGFHVALQKLGFGSDADRKWIGFNGDIHLVEGLSLGGSVRGLKINLTTGALSFDGVGISFSIPGVLTIDGEIDHIHVDGSSRDDFKNAGLLPSVYDVTDPKGAPAGTVKHVDLFAGQVKVVVEAAGGLEVDANFIVGNFGGQSVFFLDIDAELPVGIPLFLDVSLYGLQGLVACGLQPEPEPDHTWWEWYKYPAGPDLSQAPDYSATDVNKWLVPKDGAFALGAGATIGTSVDDGFTVSAAIMLILELPGPVISLIGKANILSKRLGGASEDAYFEAMATFDGNSGTFDLTIDAHYQIPIVLDIEATAELYVDANQGEWFFALGLPPHDKRVKARIFDLFETDAYFVVSNAGLVTGTWTGYKNSWRFGPLSASLDCYLATLIAIQWSPLQVSGGIELHGDIHLKAFGIGVGITADALLEGCAPNPFWVHGEISVELDLPWPLPNPSATISLTWGGDDGSIPPAPLALSHIDATLVDHTDANDKPATDHYVLLAHRPGGPMPDLPVQYDVPGTVDNPDKPGILNLMGNSLTNWRNRVNGLAPEDILPDLDPNAPQPSAGDPVPIAPVVPQDAHFTLSFAHPVVDGVGFVNLTTALPPELVTVQPPPPPGLIAKDDLSNINPQPPSVQFEILHNLSEVSLYEYDGSAWNLLCHATPAPAPSDPPPPVGPTYMNGVWVVPPPNKQDPRQVQIQLKVFPWQLLPGDDHSAQWSSQTAQKTYPTSFTDQGLSFTTGTFTSVTIDGIVSGGIVPGLFFQPDFGKSSHSVTITFPQKMVVTSIVALTYMVSGEFTNIYAPDCTGDGSALTPLFTSQDATTRAYTLTFDSGGRPIKELTLNSPSFLFLYSIEYTSAPVPMAILPEPKSLYAIKTVTQIQAGRFNGGTPDYQDVPNGNPIVEFAYFQTATGPGTAEIGGDVPPPVPPLPAGPSRYPVLSSNCGAGQTPASFPLAGALGDLTTYTQWSWPLDGSLAAYYGYDLNVEFVESYVNALYTAFSSGSVANSLHFRCVDRNHNHTLLVPLAIHLPSIPQQSALVAETYALPLPQIIAPPSAPGRINLTHAQEAGLQKRSAVALEASKAKFQFDQLPLAARKIDPTLLAANSVISARGGAAAIGYIDPVIAGKLLHLAKEQAAAAAATQLWFRPLFPKTRYTLDVVAGPLLSREQGGLSSVHIGNASLAAVLTATDAISLLVALKAYFAYEDALTTLKRVQFTTSRYKTFTDQMANVTRQLAGVATAAPLRHYATATNAENWVNTSAGLALFQTAKENYLTAVRKLNDLVAIFNPLADNLLPRPGLSGSGSGDLVADRAATTQTWGLFQQASSAIFDGLIAALGLPQFASGQKPSQVPDTEISLITDTSGLTIEALLIESPEPLPWLRIWKWVYLTPASPVARGLRELFVAWNADGTRGLIVPMGQPRGFYSLSMDFQGNIGAQAPCITFSGVAIAETAILGTVSLGALRRRFPTRV